MEKQTETAITSLLEDFEAISHNPSREVIDSFKSRLVTTIADQYKIFKEAKTIQEKNLIIMNIRKIRVQLGVLKTALEKKPFYKKRIEGKTISENDKNYIKGMQDIIDDFVREAYENIKNLRFHSQEVELIKEELSEIAYDKKLAEKIIS